MAYRTLSLETKPPLAYIRLTRPERGNPIDGESLQELDAACAAINDDPQLRVAILTAEGDVFSSGWDPAALQPEGAGPRPPKPPNGSQSHVLNPGARPMHGATLCKSC